MSLNPNADYGRAMLDAIGGIIPSFGNVHVVFASSDASDDRVNEARNVFKPYAGLVRLWTSLEDALDATITNNNDVVVLDGDGTHSLSEGYTLSKNRVNIIGVGAADRLVQQGAKIAVSGAVDTGFILKDLGVRNSFINLKFIQSSTHANALSVLQLGGEGGLLKNVSAVFGVADNLDQATAYEVVAGSDSYTYLDCVFGADTLLTSAARSVFRVDIVNGSQEFKSNMLKGCKFLISSSNAGAQFVSMAAATDILFTNHFEDCSFIASLDSAGGVALTRAVSTANGTTKGTLLFSYPRTFNCTDFGTNGTNNDNLRVVAPLVSNTDLVGVAPIAT